MIKFTRTYTDDRVIDRLYTLLKEGGAEIETRGKKLYNKESDPVYLFSTATGSYILKEGVIESKSKNSKNPISFEVQYVVYSTTPKIDITATGSSDDSERIKEILNKIEYCEKSEKNTEKLKWGFSDCRKAAENMMKSLDEMKIKYRIRPRSQEKQPEYFHDASSGRDYLIGGVIEVEGRDVSFDLKEDMFGDGMTIYSVSDSEDKDFIKEVMKRIEPEKVGTSEKTIEVFGGKKVKIADYKWDDIGGLEDVKDEIEECIEWPLKNYDAFSHLGIRVPKGILLYGPPGTGKTLIAKTIASETKAYFFQASAAELTSKWYGESEKLVKELFENAREYKPSIIFIDEIDGLFTSRDNEMNDATRRMLSVFLQELDGFEDLRGTVIVGATNRYKDIDQAVIRAGRFDRLIEIPLPNYDGRKQIFKVHTGKMPMDNVNVDKLSELTDSYSGADIEALCQRAGYEALRKYIKEKNIKVEAIKKEEFAQIKITQEDFLESLNKMKDKKK